MLWNLNWSWLKIRLLRKSRLLLSGGRTRLDRVTHWPEDYHTRSVCGRSRRRGHFVQTALPETTAARPRRLIGREIKTRDSLGQRDSLSPRAASEMRVWQSGRSLSPSSALVLDCLRQALRRTGAGSVDLGLTIDVYDRQTRDY